MPKSIIWSDGDGRGTFADTTFVKALDLESFINVNRRKKTGGIQSDIRSFFTRSEETILLREELFEELLLDPELFKRLDESFDTLIDLFELQRLNEAAYSNEQLIYSIKTLERYTGYFRRMRAIFSEKSVKSKSLEVLRGIISPVCDSDDFTALCKAVDEQIHDLDKIKSVTIGVNLNERMLPIEAGLVSVHEERYVSGEFLDKLLRLDFDKKALVSSAPLLPLDKALDKTESEVMRASVNSALNKVLGSSLRSWASVVKKYRVGNLFELIPIAEEWRFVAACVDALSELRACGYGLCIPRLSSRDHVEGLYHPMLALNAGGDRGVIRNDLDFDSSSRIYILTGPNQGGKSIYTQSVGLLYAMLHLGLPLPARSAELHPADEILVHFIDLHNKSYTHGRLAEECDRMHEINKLVTENSIFLFDEALSSTSAVEGAAIAREIITAYSDIGARGIFTTHLHELCSLQNDYAFGKSPIKNLSAQIDETSHDRSFKIAPGDYGRSYAADIARKFKLTKSEILEGKQ